MGEFDSHMVHMNTNSKGRIAELLAQAKYISLGYVVLQPVNKDGVYDFVIEKEDKFLKIQVKVIKEKDDFYQLKNQMVSSGITYYYQEGDFDYLVGVNIVSGEIFQVPFSECTNGEVRLRKEAPKNGQKALIKFASDYKLGEG